MSRIGACPTCRKSSALDPGNPWRPFCSERCKLIDLGAWAAEQHAIPGEVVETDDDVKRDDEH